MIGESVGPAEILRECLWRGQSGSIYKMSEVSVGIGRVATEVLQCESSLVSDMKVRRVGHSQIPAPGQMPTPEQIVKGD